MISTTTLAPSFAHLSALTDDRGVFEHAEFDRARREHGYCVDDVARALIVVSREPEQTPELGAARRDVPEVPGDRAARATADSTTAWPSRGF